MSRSPGHVERYLRELHARNPAILRQSTSFLAAMVYGVSELYVTRAQRVATQRAIKNILGKSWKQQLPQRACAKRRRTLAREAYALGIIDIGELEKHTPPVAALSKPRLPAAPKLDIELYRLHQLRSQKIEDAAERAAFDARFQANRAEERAASLAERIARRDAKIADRAEQRRDLEARNGELSARVYPGARLATLLPKPRPVTLETLGLLEPSPESD